MCSGNEDPRSTQMQQLGYRTTLVGCHGNAVGTSPRVYVMSFPPCRCIQRAGTPFSIAYQDPSCTEQNAREDPSCGFQKCSSETCVTWVIRVFSTFFLSFLSYVKWLSNCFLGVVDQIYVYSAQASCSSLQTNEIINSWNVLGSGLFVLHPCQRLRKD
jgi:hypothetical protein